MGSPAAAVGKQSVARLFLAHDTMYFLGVRQKDICIASYIQ